MRSNHMFCGRVAALILGTFLGVAACGGRVTLEPGDSGGGGTGQGGDLVASSTSGVGGGQACDGEGGTACPDTSDPGDASYFADAWSGGLDHITLRKADPVRNVCVMLHLAHPESSQSDLNIDLPEQWGASHAEITDQASDCDGLYPTSGTSFPASGALGSITFELPPNGFMPCQLNVDLTLLFPDGPSWLPASEPLSSASIIVENGCF